MSSVILIVSKPMNSKTSSLRRYSGSIKAALLFLVCIAAAYGSDTYSPANKQLSIPTVAIGYATYSNMVVSVGSIVSGPTGTAPNGSEDRYNPANNELTVPEVTVGANTYYNVVATVASLVSIGGVAGADSYNGTELRIPFVQVAGGSLYANVVISVGSIISMAGGMPAVALDTYNSATNQLAIPAVVDQVNGRIYTNVVVTGGKVVSLGASGYTLSAAALSPGIVTAGSSSTSTLTVTPANGYTGSVSLACGTIGGGLQAPGCSFRPSSVTINSFSPQSSALTVSTSINTPGGTYAIPVSGSDANKLAPINGAQALSLTAAAVIQHVVIIYQENRTPDNLFQDPVLISRGADIATSGKNSLGQTIPLTPIDLGTTGPNPQDYDLGHANIDFVNMYDGGKMDGADRVKCFPPTNSKCPHNPQFRYVIPADVQPYFALAEQYTFGDRMFQTNQGASFPAHQFIISGTSAPTATSSLFAAENPPVGNVGCTAPPGSLVKMIDATGSEKNPAPQFPCFEHPTLTDLLDTKGLSWRYYTAFAGTIWTGPNAIEHICQQQTVNGVLICNGPIWTKNVIIPQSQVLTDIANGQLAQVSWVMPDGKSSDHATANDGSGPAWVASIVNAIGNSAYWANTAIIITWDDWGGFYDHVAPKVINDGVSWGSGYVYGFRVPLIVVSPYAKAAYISHATHDFGSILKFIETTYTLPSLGYADVAADDLSDCFNLTQTPLTYKQVPAALTGAFFINDKRPPTPPDDD
jgi:phospholipase C